MLDGNAMWYVGPEVVEAAIKVLGSWTPFMVCSNFDHTTVILKDLTLDRCFVLSTGKPCSFNSSSNVMRGLASQSAYDRPVYSLLVELSAISVCNWDFQIKGDP